MKLYLKDFNNLLNPIKNLILICVKKKDYTKKIPSNLQRNLNV